MANEYTLADYQLTAKPLTKAVLQVFREASPIMEMLKWKTSTQLTQEGVRFDTLPTVPWRNIGESFTQLKSTPTPWNERTHFMGGKIDIPREYVKAESIVDNRAAQVEAILKGQAFGFNTAFFRNAPTDDEKAIIGLHYRIHNDLGSNQKFDANLDVSPDTAVTSWQHKMFDKIDDLLDRVDGNPSEKVLFMGRTIYFRFISALRSANQLFTDKEAGMLYTYYGKGGAKVVQAGYQVDQSTQILKDDESGTALTGGSDSSVYAVRFGEPNVAGWLFEAPNAEDKGETEDGVNVRTIVRFDPGIYLASPRPAAVAYGWTAA